MKISRHSEPSGLIVTRFGGSHTYDDALGALREMQELTKNASSVYEIVIHQDDLQIELQPSEVDLLRNEVISTFSNFRKGGFAFVSNIDLIFGLCRQLEMMVPNENIAISVFRSEELARKWIEEIQQIGECSAS